MAGVKCCLNILDRFYVRKYASIKKLTLNSPMHPNATTWNGFKFKMLNAPRNLAKAIGKEMLKLTDMAVAICNMMAKVLIFCFVLWKI